MIRRYYVASNAGSVGLKGAFAKHGTVSSRLELASGPSSRCAVLQEKLGILDRIRTPVTPETVVQSRITGI